MSTSVGPERVLVGRAAELDDLDDLLSAVAGGAGSTVLLEGEQGVGKTALVGALRGGTHLLDLDLCITRAAPGDQRPLGLLARAVLDMVGHAPEPGPLGQELAGLLGTLGDAGPTGAAPRIVDRASELVTALVRHRGERHPWVMVLEDVHEADDASLQVLLRLAHEGTIPRTLVVATMRPVPYRAPLAEVVTAWTRAGARYLELRPLAARAALVLAEQLVGGAVGPALRGTVATTGGNPGLVTDVVQTARRTGALVHVDGVHDTPDPGWLRDLDQVVRARLDYLPAGVGDLLAEASVLGTSFVIADVAALAGDAVADCWRTLRHAMAAGLVGARGDRLVFRHELVRGALYDGLDPARRRDLHARAARVLHEAGAPSHVVNVHRDRAR
ncbi:AAA family ATPase [Cellulomonas soli]|uniref:AAA family ATPase n=1 Tax=Cellulomonas soli TaxID=931535 RepID=UPI003F85B2FC